MAKRRRIMSLVPKDNIVVQPRTPPFAGTCQVRIICSDEGTLWMPSPVWVHGICASHFGKTMEFPTAPQEDQYVGLASSPIWREATWFLRQALEEHGRKAELLQKVTTPCYDVDKLTEVFHLLRTLEPVCNDTIRDLIDVVFEGVGKTTTKPSFYGNVDEVTLEVYRGALVRTWHDVIPYKEFTRWFLQTPSRFCGSVLLPYFQGTIYPAILRQPAFSVRACYGPSFQRWLQHDPGSFLRAIAKNSLVPVEWDEAWLQTRDFPRDWFLRVCRWIVEGLGLNVASLLQWVSRRMSSVGLVFLPTPTIKARQNSGRGISESSGALLTVPLQRRKQRLARLPQQQQQPYATWDVACMDTIYRMPAYDIPFSLRIREGLSLDPGCFEGYYWLTYKGPRPMPKEIFIVAPRAPQRRQKPSRQRRERRRSAQTKVYMTHMIEGYGTFGAAIRAVVRICGNLFPKKMRTLEQSDEEWETWFRQRYHCDAGVWESAPLPLWKRVDLLHVPLKRVPFL